MLGWLASIADWFATIDESIKSIPVKIKDFFTELGTNILEGIKEIFVPDPEVLADDIEAMTENISTQLGVEFNTLDRLFDREVAPEDVEESHYIPGLGSMKLKFLDTKYLIQGVAYMRPYIRGFVVLLLVFFVWRQIMSFIGQDPSIAHHAQQNYENWKEEHNK